MNNAREIQQHYKEDMRPFAEEVGIDIDYLIPPPVLKNRNAVCMEVL